MKPLVLRSQRRQPPAAAASDRVAQLFERPKIADRGHVPNGCGVTAVFKLIQDNVINRTAAFRAWRHKRVVARLRRPARRTGPRLPPARRQATGVRSSSHTTAAAATPTQNSAARKTRFGDRIGCHGSTGQYCAPGG